MANRQPNTDSRGGSFSAQIVYAVWQKGQCVRGYDPSQVRVDACGVWMRYTDYGNTASNAGWEIDHRVPLAKGGTDDLSNLQPLNWHNNRSKGDTYPWYCGR